MRATSIFWKKIIITILCLSILISIILIPINAHSRFEWIKPGTYIQYSKKVSFVILDNKTLQLSPKLNILNYSDCLENSIYRVIAYSELSFAMIKEVLNTTISDNPFCNYLNMIDEGSKATTVSDSEIALVYSWYTIPSFQRRLIDKDGYTIPWYSGLYIFFTPTYIAEMGNVFNDHFQNNLDAKYYGLDTSIQALLEIKYNTYTGFMDELRYRVTLSFRLTNETSYIPTLQTTLNIALVETNIPVEKIELIERLKLPLIITGVTIVIIVGLIILRMKLRKYLR